MSRRGASLLRPALALYAGVMLWLLFLQRIGTFPESYREHLTQSVNCIPFFSIRNFLRGAANNPALVRFTVVNLAGNVVMFVPLGFLLPAVFRALRPWRRLLPAALGILLAVETMQLVTKTGSWDIDDILLNLLGTALGRAILEIPRVRDGLS